MRALVVGADGFVGRWVLRHLRDAGDRSVALVGPRFKPPLDDADDVVQADVRDAASVHRAMTDAAPEVVIYLAGVTTRHDREAPDAAIGVSAIGSLNALVGCSQLTPSPRLLFVSTCYVYRASRDALSEDSPLAPDSLYAAAKLAAERALLTLGTAIGVEVVIARPFNHTGPGQVESFVVPTLASQIARIVSSGSQDMVSIEDPSIVRDFTDVRDVASAYRLLAVQGRAGEVYNVASGHGVSVGVVARKLEELAGIAIRIGGAEDPPPSQGPSTMIGDARRLESLGWRRKYPLEVTLSDMLQSYMAQERATR